MSAIQNDAKTCKNDRDPGKWVLIWEYSARAIQWIPTWQGLDDFQKSLDSCALNEKSLSIGYCIGVSLEIVNWNNDTWIKALE